MSEISVEHINRMTVEERRSVACDPAASADVLTHLAVDKSPVVREAVAANRRTPPGVLSDLAHDSRHAVQIAVASNVSTADWVLEKIERSGNDLVAQAARTALSDRREAEVTEHRARMRLARDPTTSPEVLDQLGRTYNFGPLWHEVRLAIAANPSVRPATLDWMSGGDGSVSWMVHDRVCEEVARASACSAQTLRRLSGSRSWRVRAAVAGNVHTPTDVLETLVRDRPIAVRKVVAANPAASEKCLRYLADAPREDIVCTAAQNPSLPTEVLLTFSRDRRVAVQRAAMRNPSMPLRALEIVAKGEGFDIGARCEAVANPSMTSVEVLRAFSQDQHFMSSVAVNPSTPQDVLENLSTNRDLVVQILVAGNASTPAHVVERLSRSEEVLLRLAVAERQETSAEMLTRLSRDADSTVRCAVAKNSRTPAEALSNLCADEDYRVCEAAQNTVVQLRARGTSMGDAQEEMQEDEQAEERSAGLAR